MAKFNEILSGRFNRSLQKLLSMKGGPPASQLATEIGVQFPLPLGVEFRYLEQWERFGTFNAQAGVAAVFSQIRLRNPTGSNVIAVVEKITFAFTVVDVVTVSLATTATDLLTLITTQSRLDARGRGVGATILSQGTPAALPATNLWAADAGANLNQDVILDENQELTILPGDAITLASNTANTLLRATIWWRERFLEDSERT
jgi:hypothetical protein